MDTKDIICLTLGIGTAFNTHDKITENFDVEIDCDVVEQLLDECAGDYSNFSSMLTERLYGNVLSEYGFTLYEGGWDADINGDCVHLYHDGEEVFNREDIEKIANNGKDNGWLDENIAYLEDHDISFLGLAWDEKPYSGELECYTDAGEDMIVNLEVIDKEHLQEYIDGFDINETVSLWWPNGRKIEGKGVPFDNITEHYKDYEDYLKWLQGVCDGMPN